MEYYSNELYHHGVKGQKWGVRKAKEEYKSASKNFKEVSKKNRLSGLGFGIKGIAKANRSIENVQNAEFKKIEAKAKYKAAKSKNPDKAEFNTYRKAMSKSGLVGSAGDSNNNGRSTNIYNKLKRTKGKEYADRVQKKVQNVLVADLVTTAVVAAGATFAGIYLSTKS